MNENNAAERIVCPMCWDRGFYLDDSGFHYCGCAVGISVEEEDKQMSAADIRLGRQPCKSDMGGQGMKHCTHYACRCARAEELAAMADRTGNMKFLAEAIAVHSQTVRCREDQK